VLERASAGSYRCLFARHSRENGNPLFAMKHFYVYILCSKKNGTLYTGVTSNLIKRVYEHKHNMADGFTKKYDVHRRSWYEVHESAESAITREKQIKKWERSWKIELIQGQNPEWKDLYEDICR
jgi:putative endonuclease